MRSVFILASMLSVNLMFSQIENKQDYIWMFNNDFAHDGLQAYVFDFNRSDSIPKALNEYAPVAFSGNNASICDKDGNLLFYTNGCFVADRNHDIMPNGTGLNDGEFLEEYRDGDCSNGYPGTQDVLILPDPNNENGYYILHKEIILEDGDYRNLQYSYVDLTYNNGLGEVTRKNQNFGVSNRQYMYDYLTAIKHENKSDWWIVQPENLSKTIQVFSLTTRGIQETDSFEVPSNFLINSSATGTASFSPDGTKYALFNAYDNLLLYDFDRLTGEFSNLKQLEIKNISPSDVLFSCLEWSSNSRFLYVAATDSLWQVDVSEENLEDGLELIDVWNGVNDPFATTFVLMALAPDCKIYMCSGSGTLSYHVINEPNKKGKECDFVQQGIRLPFFSATATMPNFPRFRVDDDKKCDPGITSVFGDLVFYRRDLNVFPNPFADQITVELPENKSGQIVVFDMQGRAIWRDPDIYHRGRVVLDLSHLDSGMYSIEFLPKLNEERLIYTSQVVKVE